MTKHLQNLERLCKKMQVRYGDGDHLVLQLKQQVFALESKNAQELAAKNLGRRSDDKAAPEHCMH